MKRFFFFLAGLISAGNGCHIFAQNPAPETELLQKALEKGLTYLQQNDTSLNFQSLMLYDFLKLKFGIPALKNPTDVVDPEKPGTFPYLLSRLIDGKTRVSADEINSMRNNIDRLTVSALYCDQFDFTDTILKNAQLQSDKGGYYLTHALFALQLTSENGCDKKNPASFEKMKHAIIKKTIAFIDKSEFMGDEAIEAVAFLYYSRQDALIKKEWLNKIASLQLPDGGWMRTVKKNKSNGKTTVLAVWALLETLHPEAKDISWIKKTR